MGIPSQEVGNFSEQVWGVSMSVVTLAVMAEYRGLVWRETGTSPGSSLVRNDIMAHGDAFEAHEFGRQVVNG